MHVPERGFVKRLKTIDPKLGCVFMPNIEKFVITYARPVGEPAIIHTVRSNDEERGGYRQPDQRELDLLHQSDLSRETAKTRLAKSAKYMEEYREKKKKEAANNLRDMTKDGYNQLRNAFGRFEGGKNNSAFRRITPKPKGRKVKPATDTKKR